MSCLLANSRLWEGGAGADSMLSVFHSFTCLYALNALCISYYSTYTHFMCASLHSCVFHDRLIYHSPGPAGACRLLCKAQSCAWLSKGLGFLGSGSHQSQLEYDTQWPQWSELVMSLVWLAVYLPLARPSPFCFISLSLSFTLCLYFGNLC